MSVITPSQDIYMKDIEKRFLKEATSKLGIKNGQTKRLAKRHKTTIELITLNENHVQHASINDFSASGARIEIPFPIPVMGQLLLGVRLPESTEIIKIGGRVVWVKSIPKAQGRYQVGVQFYNIDWRLNKWLFAQTANAVETTLKERLMEPELDETPTLGAAPMSNEDRQHQNIAKEEFKVTSTEEKESKKLDVLLEYLASRGKMSRVFGELGGGEEKSLNRTQTMKASPSSLSSTIEVLTAPACSTNDIANDSSLPEATIKEIPSTHSIPPGKLIIDEHRYEALLIRLGQLEAEKKYLIEYQAHQEEKAQELEQARKKIAELEAELIQVKVRRPWWRFWKR